MHIEWRGYVIRLMRPGKKRGRIIVKVLLECREGGIVLVLRHCQRSQIDVRPKRYSR